MEKPTIMYLCNGNREGCKKNTCHLFGGECKWTKDIRSAINFEPKSLGRSYYEKEVAPQRETTSEIKEN